MKRPLVLLVAGSLVCAPLAAQGKRVEPGPQPVDVFHPDVLRGDEVPAETFGGRMIIHLPSLPGSMNRVIENSAVVREMLYDLHETLLHQDWETWEWNPRLCTHWDTEDMLVLEPGAARDYGDAVVTIESKDRTRHVVYGDVTETDGGYRVSAGSEYSALGDATLEIPSDAVESLERGTVFTFYLRENIKWHDGHVFDADDVWFSWHVYKIPGVDCEETRSIYDKVIHCEVPLEPSYDADGKQLDAGVARLFYREQFYEALDNVGRMPLSARHVYDLSDPDNSDYAPGANDERRAKYINEHPANHMLVGLGPYRLTEFSQQYIDAVRFPDYFDNDHPTYGPHLDAIRWRYIADDNTAMQAAINGELDLFRRVKSVDYFGELTESPEFKKNLYKGYYYTGSYGYTAFNMRRRFFSDRLVREALCHAFDLEKLRDTTYKGLANIVSGPAHYHTDAYNRDILPPKYDPELAEEQLAEAGWYDRDGDGIVDKDGLAFEVEFLYPSGNQASETIGLKYQEALANIGVKLNMANLEWAAFLERILDRKFDMVNLAWGIDIESDPEQVWHSKWAPVGVRSSNHAGMADAEVDRLIEAIQVELDKPERMELWHQLHARIAYLHPYLFMMNSPRKFALNKRIRGFQTFMMEPGYSTRRLYLAPGSPGTRAQL